MATGDFHVTPTLPGGTLVRRSLVAIAGSVAVNFAITSVALFVGVAPNLQQLSYGPVLLFTAVGATAASIAYAVLRRTVESPDWTFTALAAVTLLVSTIPNFTMIPNEPGGTVVGAAVLALMHVTTAVVCVAVLTEDRPPLL